MDLIETLRTTGAIREFEDAPVVDDVLYRVLDTARFAPSGGNRQGWHIVVVRDPEVRRQIRDLYLPGWYEYLALRTAGLVPFAPLTNEGAAAEAAQHADAFAGNGGDFAERLDQLPVLLVLLADLRALAAVDKDLSRYTLAGGASIYPFAWNLLLAARAEGLGGVITTMPIRREAEMKALLEVPEELVVAALIVLGQPKRHFRKLTRQPVESFTTIDRFGGEPLTPGQLKPGPAPEA